MEYDKYVQSTQHASKLVEKGDYEQAITALEALIMSDISDLDKSMMCLNIGVVYDKMGRTQEALAWYDKGIRYEQPYSRFTITEQKAVYLAEKGYYQESLDLYEGLLAQPYLTENDKERVRNNINILRKQLR